MEEKEFQPCADCPKVDNCYELEKCSIQETITEDVAKIREEDNDELR